MMYDIYRLYNDLGFKVSNPKNIQIKFYVCGKF